MMPREMGPRRLTISAWAAVLALLAAGSPARAHKFDHPKTIHVAIRDKQLELVITYDVNPGDESRMLRALFDRDTNGRLDEDEQKNITRYLEKTAMLFFEARIGGGSARLVQQKVLAHKIDLPVEATQSLGVTLRYVTPLAVPQNGGEVSVVLIDRDKDAAKHVPVIADVRREWRVVWSNQGEFHPTTREIHRVRLDKTHRFELRLREAARTALRTVGQLDR